MSLFITHAKELEWALSQASLRCKVEWPNGPANPIAAYTSATLYLAVATAEGKGNKAITARLVEALRELAAGGNEPSFTSGPFWGYALETATLALLRHTPCVWHCVDVDTRARLNLLMECFLALASYTTDDENDYFTGPLGQGNFHKDWNPNHRMAMVFPAVFAAAYFGPDEANARLTRFDFDATLARLHAFGFTNATACWESDPANRALFMDGGTAHFRVNVRATGEKAGEPAGSGTGVRHPYHYHGHALTDIPGIVRDLYAHNFDGGPVISDTSTIPNGLYTAAENPALAGTPKAYIADHTPSPWEGQLGLMHEFCSFDYGGIRSSADYGQVDFLLVASTAFTLHKLGLYSLFNDPTLYPLARVGMADFLYKAFHGYESFSIGASHGVFKATNTLGLFNWQHTWDNAVVTTDRRHLSHH